ncbi:MAG: hypothetical protein HXX20_10970 [Chloroflexi bacterium]|nr:hypothetical protein [Chloroflexota bacterium]
MDEALALKTIAKYFENKANPSQYEAALTYFETTTLTRSRLVALYKRLVAPGGINCETCQTEMLRFVNPLARLELSSSEQEHFLLHLSQCVTCAEEYLALASFEQGTTSAEPELEIPRFKVPKPSADTKEIKWLPSLHPIITQIIDTAHTLKTTLRFELKPPHLATAKILREATHPYQIQPPTQFVLLTQQIGSELPINLQIIASRSSSKAKTCEISLILEGSASLKRPVGQVVLSYSQLRREELTDEEGRATFAEVPIVVLPEIQLEITVKL